MRNFHLIFDWHYEYIEQKKGEDFVKFCGLLRIYEPYISIFSELKVSKNSQFLTPLTYVIYDWSLASTIFYYFAFLFFHYFHKNYVFVLVMRKTILKADSS